MTILLTVAQALAASSSGTLAATVGIVDTARNVADNFDALHGIVGHLGGGIRFTNGGRPGLAITPLQLANDLDVLNLISPASPYLLEQRVNSAQAITATLANGFHYFAVVDTAAGVTANLPAIEAMWKAGRLGAVRLTDAGKPVLLLTAAQVAANPDALALISVPYSIALTDPGTPTVTLPSWAAYFNVFTNVTDRITTPFNLALGLIRPSTIADLELGVSGFNVSYASGQPVNVIAPFGSVSAAKLPGGLQATDWEVRLSVYLDALQVAAAAGKLSSVPSRESGLQILSLTPQQRVNDAQALAKFSPNFQFSQIITAAEANAPVLAPGFFNFTVQDSVANVMANIVAIDRLAHNGQMAKLRFTEVAPDIAITAAQLGQAAFALNFAYEPNLIITLTDPGIPTVTVAGDVLAFFNVRNLVLNRVTTNYHLVVTGAVWAVVNSLTSIRVSDSVGDIVLNLGSLQTLAVAGSLTAINITNGGVQTLPISLATAAANSLALAKVTSPYVIGSVTKTPVSESAASFVASIGLREGSAESGTLGSVTLTDGGTPALALPALAASQGLLALSAIGSPHAIALTDSGTPALVLRAWQITSGMLAELSRISTPFTFTISGPLGAFQAAVLASSSVLTNFTGPVSFTDFANNFSNNFPGNLTAIQTLYAGGHTGTITFNDSLFRLQLTSAEVLANPAALAAITSPFALTEVVTAAAAAATTIPASIAGGIFDTLAVQDSVANILASLGSLEPLAVSGKLSLISFTGTSPFSLAMTAADFAANADALTKISGGYSIALTDSGTPTVTLQQWQVSGSIVQALGNITTPFSLAVSGVVRANSAAALANGGTNIISKLLPGSLTVRDPSTNIESPYNNYMPQLLLLAQAGKLASVNVRDGEPIFSQTIAEALTNAPVLALMTTHLLSQVISASQAGTPPALAAGFVNYTVQDSVSNILAALPQIEALATNQQLGRLQYTDLAPRTVISAADLMAGADAFGAQDYAPYPVLLTDPGTPVITLSTYQLDFNLRNNVLNNIVGPWTLHIAGLADAGTLAVIAEENNGVLAHLSGPVVVAGYSYAIQPYIDQLAYLAQTGKISAVQLIDGGAPVITVTHAQLVQDSAVFATGGKLQGPYTLLVSGPPVNDFNGDGRSDLIWQNDNGQPAIWELNGFGVVASAALLNPGPAWRIAGTGDFNGNGRAEIVFQKDDGTPAIWQVNGIAYAGGATLPNPGPTWHIRGVGDFNGDGRSEILFQNDNGSVAVWQTNGTSYLGGATLINPGPTWHIKGTGDFNGNGKSEILFQNENGSVAIWQTDGTTYLGGAALPNPGANWHIEGTGDFNADGKSDILFQNDNGSIAIWELNGTSVIGGATLSNPGASWHVKGSADYNGDGKSDILFQNDDGRVAMWEMDGTSVIASGNVGNAGPSWHTIGTDGMRFISGATGNGTLAATSQDDGFIFTSYAAGTHAISGFNPAHDLIEFSLAKFANFAAVQSHSTAVGGSTLIALDTGASLTIQGVLPASLVARDFRFV
jgi:hypothetical protein